jgi:transposase
MGRQLQLEWNETAIELKERYLQEAHPQRRTRLQALWHLRCGKPSSEVAAIVGIAYRTLQYWVAWYRGGGLPEVLRRVKGYGSGSVAKLTALQQRALVAKIALGLFRTISDVLQWVVDRWGIAYSYSGIHDRLQQLGCAPKEPRPQSANANPKQQEQWKATGLFEALHEAGITCANRVWFCDEMRFGLWGQVRRRWGVRGVKIIQKVQIEFAWEYLVLAIDVIHCELRWGWAARMNQTSLLPIFSLWSPDAVIWDGASAHRGKAMGEIGFRRIVLPPYSPELNPAERVFEWLRAKIEGEVYTSLRHKRLAIDQQLRRLSADKASLDRLIGWQWIQVAFAQLSA